MSHRPVIIKFQLGALHNLSPFVRNAPTQSAPQKRIDLAMLMQSIQTLRQRGLQLLQWIERKRTEQFSSRRLRIAETMSLGEKRFVSIVQVDGVEMLLAGAPGNVTLLTVLEPKQSLRPQRVARMEQSS
jgi:flagellar biogenesis protein FliO